MTKQTQVQAHTQTKEKTATLTKVATKQLYTPILVSKAGELQALSNLTEEQRDGLLPLIQVNEFNNLGDNESENGKMILKAVEKLVKAVAGRPFMCDLDFLAVQNGTEVAEQYFQLLLEKHQSFIPVVGLGECDHFDEFVTDRIPEPLGEVAIRVTAEDFNDAEWDEALDELADEIDLERSAIHVVLDFGGDVVAPYVVATILAKLPTPKEWASVVVASCGMPAKLSDYSNGSLLARRCWTSWNQLIGNSKLPVRPVFGDYAITNPDAPTDLNFKFVDMLAKIKYTTDESWVFQRGKGIKKNGFSQFHDLAKQMIAREEFKGANYSWGDQQIAEIAGRNEKPGNMLMWVAIGVNHHIVFTMEQVASLDDGAK